jgi:hypothetical protein
MFDLNMKAWREVYSKGQLSSLTGFTDKFGWGGPGKRWKFSMTNDDEIVAIFGGFRLWHGFAQENTQYNDWKDYSTLPPGGYMDDFWFYTKVLDTTTKPGSNFKTTNGIYYVILIYFVLTISLICLHVCISVSVSVTYVVCGVQELGRKSFPARSVNSLLE